MKIILEGTPNELADLIAGVWQRTYEVPEIVDTRRWEPEPPTEERSEPA